MSFDEIAALPVGGLAADKSDLYLYCRIAGFAEVPALMKINQGVWGERRFHAFDLRKLLCCLLMTLM
jgi:hypothetical protein